MILLLALLFGLASAGLCLVTWKVVGETFGRPDLLLIPPLGCRLCSSWWASVIFTGYAVLIGMIPIDFMPIYLFASVAIAYVALQLKERLG